jgi:transcriptional regulator with XRE-family HTH domain
MGSKSLAERLIDARHAARLSQEGLANAAGIDAETIRRIESGKTPRPRPGTLRTIEGVLVGFGVLEDGELSTTRPVPDKVLGRAHGGRGARLYDLYTEALEADPDGVDLLGCGFRQVREDFGEMILDVSLRVPLRMLLLDPAAGFADQRDREEGTRVGQIRDDINDWIAFLATTTPSNRIAVRTYSLMPAVQITRIGNWMGWGPYLVGTVSRNMPTLLCDPSQVEWTPLVKHFELVWSHPLTRPLRP